VLVIPDTWGSTNWKSTVPADLGIKWDPVSKITKGLVEWFKW
jgi:hypothetical protein